MSNLGMRVLALLLAFAVWFVVSAPRRERVSERAFAAPLSLVGMPRNLMITTPVPDTVSVRLRGRVPDLRSLSSQTLELTVDLSWAQAGDVQITLRPQALNIPPEVEVLSIQPAKIHFRVEQLRQKGVAIRAFLVGQPPAGYAAGDATVMPEKALVSGPASLIRNVSEVATERIIMTGRTAPFVQNVAVVSDTQLVRVVEPLTVQVTVPVLAESGPSVSAADNDSDSVKAKAEPPRRKRPRKE
ncbi:MAG TPA: CdaR family protein [Thermoanaerobaculia bacterium]|nr:CdaR family protein [Thermoanaerobaculia bacterium]